MADVLAAVTRDPCSNMHRIHLKKQVRCSRPEGRVLGCIGSAKGASLGDVAGGMAVE